MRIKRVFVTIGLIAVAACLFCISSASPALAEAEKLTVRVMTRNMDAGTDLNYVAAATTEEEFPGAVMDTIIEVMQSRIPERAALLAAEIAATKPDLVALQEVTTWEIESESGTIVLNQLDLLMAALRAAGQHYRVAVVQTLTDIQVPGAVSFTDHDAILVRVNGPGPRLNVIGTETHLYDTLMDFPVPGGKIPVLRGWIAADIRIHEKKHDYQFKFVNTHLESAIASIPETAYLQLAQAEELLESLSETRLPIILAGDFNSDAEPTHNYPGDATQSYDTIAASGYTDAWHALRPRNPGYTWPLFWEDQMSGQTIAPIERIDLIFSKGPKAISIENTGTDPNASGLYSSDHRGVVATFKLPHVAPHLKFTLLANCCLIQNDTTKETVGRWNQHHPVFFSNRLAVTFVRNQIRSPKIQFV